MSRVAVPIDSLTISAGDFTPYNSKERNILWICVVQYVVVNRRLTIFAMYNESINVSAQTIHQMQDARP